jgi:hypothetical protein
MSDLSSPRDTKILDDPSPGGIHLHAFLRFYFCAH